MDLTPLEKDGIEPAQPLQKKEKDFIMQPNYSVSLPHYSVGPEAYSLVGDIIRPYGTRVAVVGGETAMTKANPSLLPALEAAGLTVTDVHVYGHDSTAVTDVHVYGHDSTVANVEAIKARSGVRNADVILAVGGGRCCDAVKTAADMMGKPVMTCPTVASNCAPVSASGVRNADVILAVGGGRCCDAVKTAADMMGKPVMTCPTVASNCAPVSAIAVLYKEDGSLHGYHFGKACPAHCFINTSVIMDSPEPLFGAGLGDALSTQIDVLDCTRGKHLFHTPLLGAQLACACPCPAHCFINTSVIMDSPEPLFWAGLGDALSKQIEVLYCTRGKHLFHTPLLGAQLACACQEPLLQFGRQALDDFRAKTMSDAFTECVLDIIVSTGVVSNLVTHTEYYYNSSLAHCFYNASMVLPSAHAHLHGEVVSFGNLVLLAYDGQDELLERFLDFNTSIGLPVTLAQVGITTDEQLMKLVSAAEHIKEWSTGPEPAVREQFVAAIRKVDTLGAARLAAAA